MSSPSSSADRNLIFGLLALQMDFVTSEQLLDAMNAWMRRKATPVGAILRERGLLSDRRLELLHGMVEEHIAQHGGDAQASLAALRLEGSVRTELSRIDDEDVQASVSILPPVLSGAAAAAAETLCHADADSVGSPETAAPLAAAPSGARFRRLRGHAKGGLGEVFVALDGELNREVALKEIQDRFADELEARSRFLREAEITGKLEHPGVVPVYALGAYPNGRPYYAMRFIRGGSMEHAITRFHKADDDPRRDPGERSLALRELLTRFVAVCNAMAYAHSRGVIHRDLKPANIMLGEYGETLVVDWGLARALDRPSQAATTAERPISAGNTTTATEMGQVVGTPAYMPPEQASGRLDQVGIASDVFALGATLYCLLTGQPPYSGMEALNQAAMAEFVPARQRKGTVPAALEAVCGKAMAAQPQDRYPTARALADEVQRFLADEPVQAYPEPLGDRLRRWGRRNRSVVSAGVVLLVAGVAGLSVGLWAVGREQERTKAALGRALTAEDEAKASARLAAEEKEKAQKAEAATLADYRASTDDAIEQLIRSKSVLGAQEKTYLEKTLKRWEVFAARSGDDERSRAIRAEGQFRVAVLREKLGQTAQALAGYREALAVYEKLADEFPAASEYRKELGQTHHKLGRLLAGQKRWDKAREHYDKALAIRQKLTDEFPTLPDYRNDLAATHTRVGSLLAAQNQWKKSAQQYRKALAIQQKLAHEFPAERDYRNELGRTHFLLGLLLAGQKQWEQSAQQYHKSLAIREKLADDFPAVSDYRSGLAATHTSLGNLLLGQNQPEKSDEQYHKALAIYQKLAGDFPAVPDYRTAVAITHMNLGLLLAGQNQSEKAAEQYHKALAIQHKLADDFPAAPEYGKRLADTHINLGLLLAGHFQWEKSAQHYHSALAIQQKLAGEFPAVPDYRRDLARTHNNLGALLVGQNQPEKSANEYRKALAIYRKLAGEFPAVPDYRWDLARTHTNLGALLVGQNQPEKSAHEYRNALAIYQKLAGEFPAVPDYRMGLAAGHIYLGLLLADQNQPEKSAQEYRTGLAIQQKLADEFPAVPDYRWDLARTHNNLGALLRSQNQWEQASEQCRKALAIYQKLADDFPTVPAYRQVLADSHNHLGSLLGVQKQRDQAAEQYRKALVIYQNLADDFPAVAAYRMGRAYSRVGAGQVTEGVADVAEWTKSATVSAEEWYYIARVYALASSNAIDKKQEYADRAMELLHKAVKAGFRNAEHMARESDLQVLRQRDDFKKLMQSLAKPTGKAPAGKEK